MMTIQEAAAYRAVGAANREAARELAHALSVKGSDVARDDRVEEAKASDASRPTVRERRLLDITA
ncbi:MAG: hypothetical protein R3C52_04955 [Hyphomonadaceae bacterium]